jgi:capsular polysaccharide biosynthesis protein
MLQRLSGPAGPRDAAGMHLTANDTESAVGVASLSEYVRLARRRWPSLVIGLMIGVLAGIAWYMTAPQSYEARATVTINPITNDLFSNSPVNQLVNTATEAEIMRSIEIAERAAAQSDLDGDPRDLRNQLAVAVPPSSLALEISFTADSPEVAATGANAFATSYLDFREETAEARRAGYAEQLRSQLRDLTEQAVAAGSGAASQVLSQEIIAVRQQLGDATSLPISAGQLVSKALPPRFPTSPRRLPAIAGGFVVGLLLGIGLAAIRHRRDDRLFTADEVSTAAGLPVIGSPPGFDCGPRLEPREADDVALAAMRLTSSTFGHGLRSWVVLRADLGRPTRADVLAWWLGRGHDVVLVRLGVDDEGNPATNDGHWDLSALPPSPGLWTRSTPVRAVDGYVVLDGGGLHGLAEAIGIQGVSSVLVAVELGVTRTRDLERTVNEIRSLSPELLAPGILVIKRRSWAARSWRGWIRSALPSQRRRRHEPFVREERPTKHAQQHGRVSATLGSSEPRP